MEGKYNEVWLRNAIERNYIWKRIWRLEVPERVMKGRVI